MGNKTKKATIKFKQNRLKDVIGDRKRTKQRKSLHDKSKDERKAKSIDRQRKVEAAGPRPTRGEGVQHGRELGEMNVDEFMDGGLEALLAQDSDESDVDVGEEGVEEVEGQDDGVDNDDNIDEDDIASDEAEALADGAQESDNDDNDENDDEEDDEDDEELLSEVKEHQAHLEKLKQQDPEFFQYLEAEDQQLLEFGDDDSDGEPAGSGEEASDDGDEAEAELGLESTTKSKGRQELSRKTVRAWASLMDKHPAPALRHIVQGFAAASFGLDPEAEAELPFHLKYIIRSSTAYSAMVQLGIEAVPELLDRLLPAKGKQQSKLPSDRNGWRKLKPMVKMFTKALLNLVPQTQDLDALAVIFKRLLRFAPYVACFPKLCIKLFKVLLPLWTSDHDGLTVASFLMIRSLTLTAGSSFAEVAFKGLYLAFAKNCKFTTVTTLNKIVLLRNSVCELYMCNQQLAYKHAFTYIRQLAVHLRDAIVSKKKDNIAKVYSWPYAHCISLWCQVLERYLEGMTQEQRDSNVMSSLIYPLAQVTLGTVNLVPVAKYYPLRFHCLKALNRLAAATNTFIPVAFPALMVLDSADMGRKPKPSTNRPLNFDVLIKVSKINVGTPQFQEAVVEGLQSVLLDFFSIHACSLGFPELIVPCCLALRRFFKTCKNGKLKQSLQEMLARLNDNSQWLSTKRATVTFSPKDEAEVTAFEHRLRASKESPLLKYAAAWQQIIESKQGLLQKQAEARYAGTVAQEMEEAAAEPVAKGKKGKRKAEVAKEQNVTRTLPSKKSKQQLQGEIQDLLDNADDDDEEVAVGEDLSWMNE